MTTTLSRLLASGEPPATPARLIQTSTLRNATLALHLAIRQHAILLLDGLPGTGKTTTAAALIHDVQRDGTPAVYVAIPARPSPTEVLRVIIEAISGTPALGTKHDLENEARAMLADQGGLLVVDEVQNLKATGMQELRYLHDDAQANFSLLIAGWQADRVIRSQPDLDSRVKYRIAFDRLTAAELIPTVTQLNAMLAATDPATLRHIDKAYARGILRNWATFAQTAQMLLPTAAHLEDDDVTAILAVIDSRASA